MEDSQFDQLACKLAQRTERRHLVLGASAGLAALLATGTPDLVEAGKKKKRKKKKKQQKKKGMCTSAYGQKLRCKPNQCCDPGTSTIASCTEIGFPTCCASSGLAHPLGTTCCSSYYHGYEGACTTDYPVCCSGNVGGGCCLPNTHCCDPADFGGERYCCPTGTTCDPVAWACTAAGARAASLDVTPLVRRERAENTVLDGQAFAGPIT
jgi:hypothetical protein